MNDPRTCVYAKPRAFGAMGGGPTCTRPLRGQWCLCGLTTAPFAETVPAMLNLDYAAIEERIAADSGFVGLLREQYVNHTVASADPSWDNWKPGRDV